MKFIGIIPARYQSSRFPGKPLCDILGKPMIWHVYQSVIKWNKWYKVYVATDSNKIAYECKKLSIPFLMTKDTHVDCLDRASEVVSILNKSEQDVDRYIVIQGDEPLFNVETLNADLSPTIVNFYTEVHDQHDMYDNNAVKAVISKNQKALYFSRYSVPYHNEATKRTDEHPIIYKQIGVYSFSGEMLKMFSQLKPSHLETMEGIGLNRLIENDIEVHMRYTKHDSISVDIPEDRDRIVSIIKNEYQTKRQSVTNDGHVIDCDGYNMAP